MAGIAFRLQKLLTKDSYSGLLRAYLYSAFISTGPFLIVIGSISGIKLAVETHLNIEDTFLLLSLIVYVFAFSMLGVSPLIYTTTRYLADKYYLKQFDAFTPSYLTVLYIVFALQSLVGFAFLHHLDVRLHVKWVLLVLYLTVSGIWIAMIFVSAARSYLWIVLAFFLGGVASTGLAVALGFQQGFFGFLLGFTLGQVLCLGILTFRIFQEFGIVTSLDFGSLAYTTKHPYLFFTGILYYASIWVDKIIFWFSPHGEKILGPIRVYTNYDTSMFLAYLTVVPSMAFFLVQMETSFVGHYQNYYETISRRAGLNSIRKARDAMIDNLSTHFQKYALFQGILSGLIILFLVDLIDIFNLNPYQSGILRIGILGAFLQMGFVMVLNIAFYFDFQKDTTIMCFIFFILNGLLTLLTVGTGFHTFGFGFAIAAFLTVFVSFSMLNHKLKNLDYWTFMRQAIIIPKFKFESDMAHEWKIQHQLKQP